MESFALPPAIAAEYAERRSRVKSTYRSNLERLHKCKMSLQYRIAMEDPVDRTFDFDAGTHFAMKTLLPQTIKLLAAETKPSVDDLLELSWVDTKNPGVYGGLAWYTLPDGTKVYVLKIGNAWAHLGGLKGRRNNHTNEQTSIKYASTGSKFHGWIQKAQAAGYEVKIHWFTLAVGEAFKRVDPEDDWMPARFYQLEAMLSAAFGASMDSMKNKTYLAMKWWPFVDDDATPPWTGVDGHNALEDNWPPPPESTEARDDRLRCPYEDCPRHQPGQGMYDLSSLRNHMSLHEEGKFSNKPSKCFDPRCTYDRLIDADGETRGKPVQWSIFEKHEAQHINGTVECGACGLKFDNGSSLLYHVDNFCVVDDASSIHQKYIDDLPPDPKKADLVCDDWRCGVRYRYRYPDAFQVHLQSHVDGTRVCGDCGLKMHFQGIALHRKDYCPRRFDQDKVVIITHWTCPESRCGLSMSILQKSAIALHEVSHPIDGPHRCSDCQLPHASLGGLGQHKHRGCYNKKSEVEVDVDEQEVEVEVDTEEIEVVPRMTRAAAKRKRQG